MTDYTHIAPLIVLAGALATACDGAPDDDPASHERHVVSAEELDELAAELPDPIVDVLEDAVVEDDRVPGELELAAEQQHVTQSTQICGDYVAIYATPGTQPAEWVLISSNGDAGPRPRGSCAETMSDCIGDTPPRGEFLINIPGVTSWNMCWDSSATPTAMGLGDLLEYTRRWND